MFKGLPDGLTEFITKILLPAMVGISLKIAVQMKKTKLSFLNVALSFIAGISCAWLLSDLIHLHVHNQYQSICIAIIAISGEKVGDFLVYKLRVDEFLQALVVALKEVLIKIINK
jgi:hypothetical protein